MVNADVAATAVAAKSDATPVVAPAAPETAIVHTIARPRRDGLVLVHDNDDAVVGLPYTANVIIP